MFGARRSRATRTASGSSWESQVLSAGRPCRDKGRAAAAEWVENELSRQRRQFNQGLKQRDRLLRNVASAFAFGKTRPKHIVRHALETDEGPFVGPPTPCINTLSAIVVPIVYGFTNHRELARTSA